MRDGGRERPGASERVVAVGLPTAVTNAPIPPRRHHQRALGAVALGVAACVTLWWVADQVYRHSQPAGWILGLVGSAMPAGAALAFMAWLSSERKRGRTDVRVRWMWAPLAAGGLFFIAALAFSLL